MTRPTYPSSPQTERTVLGGMIKSADALAGALMDLDAADFHLPEHAALFQMLAAMHRAGKPVDLITVPEAIATGGDPNRVGGISYAMGHPEEVVSTVNADHYRGMLRGLSQRRQLVDVAETLLTDAQESDHPEEMIATASRLLEAAASRSRVDGAVVMAGDAAASTLDEMAALARGEVDGAISTGLPSLDAMIGGGIRKGELTIIGGRPGMGKTSLASQIGTTAAKDGWSVLGFSTEMQTNAWTQRQLSWWSGVPFSMIRQPKRLQIPEWERLEAARADLAGIRLAVDDRSQPTLGQMEGVVKRHKLQHDLDVVIVDYFQILGFRRAESALVGMNEMVNGLLAIAKTQDVAVILLSQLNREVSKRADPRPKMADLKACGGLEEAAHLVLFPYRPSQDSEDAREDEAEVHIGKQRSGPTGASTVVKLSWSGTVVAFEEISSKEFGIKGVRQ